MRRALPLSILLACELALAAAPDAPLEANQLHARLELSGLLGGDEWGGPSIAHTDLRLVAQGSMPGPRLSFQLDGRGRKALDNRSADRLSVSEAYLRLGQEADRWRISAGRQLIREVASAEVDGLKVERSLGEGAHAVAFAGLLPHPLTGDPNLEFLSAGAGYQRRGATSNHAGGAVASLYRAQLDRLYLTQSSYLALGPSWSASAFALVDLLAPRALLGTQPGPGPDLTTLSARLRFRPVRGFDSSLALNHHHTLLPGKWWQDWMAAQRRAQGFILDGEEPVGTRVSSARWTHVWWASPETAPYLRLRYDWRHTERARGYEAAAGVKWRPRLGYLDLSLAVRRFFATQGQLATLQAGVELRSFGVEAGATALRTQPLAAPTWAMSYEAHALAWAEPGANLGVRLLLEYQAFFQQGGLYQVGLMQVGYRF